MNATSGEFSLSSPWDMEVGLGFRERRRRVRRVRQEPMKRRHHLRPFADRGCDPFDRTAPYVANGEDALAARFERPSLASVKARQNEALRIKYHAGVRKPVRVRFGADEQEQVADWPLDFVARLEAPSYCFKHPAFTLEAGDPRAGNDL